MTLSFRLKPDDAPVRGAVLVVDDDRHIREMLAGALGDDGYAVRTAANGAEALDLVERAVPSVVLLDLWMPVLDGWGFARALEERGVAVPLALMTAATYGRRAAEDMGAAYLAKPFELDDMLDPVGRLVRQAPA